MATTERTKLVDARREQRHRALLDAVGELLAERSWDEVSMAEVAERAGVSRQTVYNAFGSRPEIARAYVRREADGFVDVVAEIIRTNSSDPTEALRGALEVFLAAAGSHPLVRAISTGEGDELLSLITTRSGGLSEDLTDRIGSLISEQWPQADAADARLAADTLVRLAISHAALPGAPPAATAADVARLLGPFIEAAIDA